MKKKSTNRKNGLWTASYEEIGATLKALQDHGVTLEHLARLRAEPEYAKRVAEHIIRGGVEDSMRNKLARVRMGQNFFGIEDWIIFYGINFSQEQLCLVPEFPWEDDILMSGCPLCDDMIKNCHFAFLGLDRINSDPLTILKLQDLHPATGQPRFASYYYDNESHYSNKKFVTETTMSSRWYLLHINILYGSGNRTFEEQEAILPAEYEVPLLIVEIAKDLFVLQKTGIYANLSKYRRCADIYSGCRVIARYFDANNGLDFVDILPDFGRRNYIYIAASRKPGV